MGTFIIIQQCFPNALDRPIKDVESAIRRSDVISGVFWDDDIIRLTLSGDRVVFARGSLGEFFDGW